MLEDIVKKLSRRVRAYEEVVKRYGVNALMYGVLGYSLSQTVIKLPGIIEKKEWAIRNGMQIVKTNENTIFNENKKNHIQIYDPKTKEKETLINPVEIFNYYRYFYLAGYAFLLLRYYQISRKKILKLKLTQEDRLISIASSVGGTIAGIIIMSLLIKDVRQDLAIEVQTYTTPLFFCLGKEIHERYLLHKRFKHAKETGDLENPFYLRGVAKELREKSLKALKDDKLEDACILLLEQREILRKYHQQVDLWEEGIVMYDFKHFFYRLKAMVSGSFEDELRLLLKTPVEMHELKTLDLENSIKRNPEREIELKLLDFEFETNNTRRREKGKTLYEILSKKGMIEKLEEGKSNVVSAMSCSTLGRQYVIKRNEDNKIDGEIGQTKSVKEGLRGDNGIIIPDIVIKYNGEELPELKDDAIMFMRYLKGEVMTEKLRRMAVRDQVELFKRATRANIKSSGYGILGDEEDRHTKAVEDIKNNERLSKDVMGILEDNIEVCFKFVDYFPSVYDRDGHPDNILVSDGKLVLLDFEIRHKSDPIYMVVKLLEYKSVLRHDEQGMSAREEVVNEHLSSMGNEERIVGMPHYLASILLKALSFHKFSSGRADCEGIRQRYLKSSIFGLDVIANKFSGFYKDNELKKLDNVRIALENMRI